MINTNSILSGLNNLQQDAQANNPTLPNNGNPGGANNMAPQQAAPTQGQAAKPYYPWLAPSQHMKDINELIGRMGVHQGGVVPPSSVPAQIQQAQIPAMPVMPQYAGGGMMMGQQQQPVSQVPILPRMNV